MGPAGHAARVKGDTHKYLGHQPAEDEGQHISGNEDPVDVETGQYPDLGQGDGTGDAHREGQIHHLAGDGAAGEVFHLLVEDLDRRFRLDDVVADGDADGDQQPFHPAVPRQAAPQQVAHRGKADVHAGEKENQADEGIEKAHRDPQHLAASIVAGHQLEEDEHPDHRQHADEDLLPILGKGQHKLLDHIPGGEDGGNLNGRCTPPRWGGRRSPAAAPS